MTGQNSNSRIIHNYIVEKDRLIIEITQNCVSVYERESVFVMIVCVSDYKGIRVLRLVSIRYPSAVTASVCT